MATKQQLEANADAVLAAANQGNDQIQQFCLIWNGIIKPAIELVKNFTNSDVDARLDKLINAANGVCSGNNPDVANYCNIWRTLHLKALFKTIQVFTGPKVDRAIDKFVSISDSLCP
jgi:hypothetical protein